MFLGNSSYLFVTNFRYSPIPAMPLPTRIMVAGSGTGAAGVDGHVGVILNDMSVFKGAFVGRDCVDEPEKETGLVMVLPPTWLE